MVPSAPELIERRRPRNAKAWAIGEERPGGFYVRKVVWGRIMARAERRDGERICRAEIILLERR